MLTTHYPKSTLRNHTASLMNIITPTFAASLFPRSTLVDFKKYSCANSVGTHSEAEVNRLPYYALCNGREDELPPELKSRKRWIADRTSWVLRYSQVDSFRPAYDEDEQHLLGTAFDIIDWTSFSHRNDCAIEIHPPGGFR